MAPCCCVLMAVPGLAGRRIKDCTCALSQAYASNMARLGMPACMHLLPSQLVTLALQASQVLLPAVQTTRCTKRDLPRFLVCATPLCSHPGALLLQAVKMTLLLSLVAVPINTAFGIQVGLRLCCSPVCLPECLEAASALCHIRH